ncbi:MAG TPA: phosphatase PAP2 family protein [Dehalococcoidia bacterium]|nr:phosphatase PAP2 family protein [Dehalococcoidia bacterium]
MVVRSVLEAARSTPVRLAVVPVASSVVAYGSLKLQPLIRLRRRYLAGQERHKRILLAVQVLYALLLTSWLLFTHSWPAPDVIALFLLLFAFVAARGLSFLRDWSPFVLLLLGYAALTGIAPDLTGVVHVGFPIQADRWLFRGAEPNLWLQAHFFHPGQARWYDYAATVLYPMHFVTPLVLAFVFWMWWKPRYWRFVTAYLLLCYAAFVTYLLYPMAPPWWAYRVGKLPPVHLVLYEVHYAGLQNPIVLAMQFFKPNPVAAMPSLHAAVPVLIWLTLWKTWPRWGWAAIVYPLAMGLAVVYPGEHYVIDVIAGAAYAVVAFALVWGYAAGPWRLATRPFQRGVAARPALSAFGPAHLAPHLCAVRVAPRREPRRQHAALPARCQRRA